MGENGKSKDDYLIEQFEIDFNKADDIIDVILTAFSDDSIDAGGTIEFDKETFHFMFGSPFTAKNLFIRAIHKPTGELAGFLGGIPRKLAYQDKTFNFVIPSWAAVKTKHQRNKLAFRMGSKFVEVALKEGYEGAIAYFEPEAHGKDAGAAIARDHGFFSQDIMTIRKFLIRVFNINEAAKVIKLKRYEKWGLKFFQSIQKVNNPHVRTFHPDDTQQIFDLMADFPKNNQISAVREFKDFEWYLNQPGVNCVVFEDGQKNIKGFILGWKFKMAGFGHSIPFGWLDIVHTYYLNFEESKDLVKFFCKISKELGWGGIQSPYIPYFDSKPFLKSKFLYFPKKLIVAQYSPKQLALPEEVESLYFDWR